MYLLLERTGVRKNALMQRGSQTEERGSFFRERNYKARGCTRGCSLFFLSHRKLLRNPYETKRSALLHEFINGLVHLLDGHRVVFGHGLDDAVLQMFLQ